MDWRGHDWAINPCILPSINIKKYGLTIFMVALTINYGDA